MSVTDSGCDDCNTNGIWDYADIYLGTSQDCNSNEIPDECDISGTGSDPQLWSDANPANGIPDACED